MVMDNNLAERAETARDLRAQLTGVEGAEQQEIVFKDTSPRQRKATVWNLRTGREVRIPAYLLNQTLAKRDHQTGEYLFTAHKNKAPTFTPGTIKCFLHKESAERADVDAMGLVNVTCPKATLNSEYGKRLHQEHRHASEWALYVEAQKAREAAEDRRMQQAQIDATLELARAATGQQKAAPKTKADA